MKVYGVLAELQLDLIEKRCLGDCGHAIIGCLVDKKLGEIMPCKTDVCPFLDKELPGPIGTLLDGSELYLRKIK
jgi:hypothetical protein